MKGAPSAERLQGARRHRFGLALGLAVAIALHVGLLLVPLPKDARQDAKQFQRGVVARAFRVPSAEPRPAEPRPAGPRPGSPAPVAAAPPPQPARPASSAGGAPGAAGEAGRPAGPPELPRGVPPRAATEGALAGSGPSQPAPALPSEVATRAGDGAGGGSRTAAADARPGPAARPVGKGVGAGNPGPGSGTATGKGRTGTGPDEWTALLSDLTNRGQRLKGQGGGEGGAGGSGGGKGQGAGGGAGRGRGGGAGSGRGAGGGGDGDEVLDPRIRITVVSYPASSLDESPPPVRYPDLRVHRRELTAGICRVYYRVWTDDAGRIVRTQVKTPESQEDLRRYAAFVDAVKAAVADWPFPRGAAEVHVDVLFEIE